MAANYRWTYRGEGNINLVLADAKERKVYRFVKTNTDQEKDLEKTETSFKERADQIHYKLQKTVDYVKKIMQPLLSPCYVTPPVLVHIPKGFAEEVDLAVWKVRPDHRKWKAVDFAARSALVLPDFCFVVRPNSSPGSASCGPTISIEIKPKTGFLPISKHIENGIKYKVCKFCMSSRLKAKRGLWSKPSSYCPLDLFSGNRTRVRHALYSLLDTPQNNLKICKDGVEVYSEYTKNDLTSVLKNFFEASATQTCSNLRLLDMFIDLIIDALHTPLDQSSPVQYEFLHGRDRSRKCLNSTFRETKTHIVGKQSSSKGCILERILSVQHFDDMDIEGIYPLYQRLEKHFKLVPDDRQRWWLDGPYRQDTWCVLSNNNIENEDESDIQHILIKVKKFLVAQTVKDCSIILAMQPVDVTSDLSSTGPFLQDQLGQHYWYSVSVIDLDPKPFDKIPLYYEEDAEILRTWIETASHVHS